MCDVNGKETGQDTILARRKQIQGNDVEVAVYLNKVVTQNTVIKTRIKSSECEYALLV